MIYQDPVYERALRDRDWAPPGGTSLNRANWLNADLNQAFRAALARAVADEPGLVLISHHNLPWLHWGDNPDGGWWIACGLSHEILRPEADMPTFLWASWVSDTETQPAGAVRPIDATLTGPTARDVDMLADMIVRALRPYRNAEVKA